MFERTKVALFVTLLLIAAGWWALGNVQVPDQDGNPVALAQRYSYPHDVLLMIGFAIIMAVSLNLVNGHTGGALVADPAEPRDLGVTDVGHLDGTTSSEPVPPTMRVIDMPLVPMRLSSE